MHTYETIQEAISDLNEMLATVGMEPMNKDEAKDWNIGAGSTIRDLKDVVQELRYVEHTNHCEDKDAWLYEL